METRILKVRNVSFGEGKPKVCVPITENQEEQILVCAKEALRSKPDILEWRVDWFDDIHNLDVITNLLLQLREMMGDTLLLFTIRTKNEGGQAQITVQEYENICRCACESGCIDLIDVETYFAQGLQEIVVEMAHANGVCVVASNHDFSKTPSEEEIVQRLVEMDEKGADIPKIAVMPQSQRDVLTLLSATLRYKELGRQKPMITMSMGQLGVVSRIAGELTGSCVTFACIGKASAPGQIEIDSIQPILDVLHSDSQ